MRLRTLGGLAIEFGVGQDEAGALTGAAVQRRPLALLAFLATAGERGRSRDEILLHLWPESTPARARNVLKQTLYALRRDLKAPDLFLVTGEQLRVNPAVLSSDVAEFEGMLARDECECAVGLYRGWFLEGFRLGEFPEFERWATGERIRLGDRFAEAMERLAAAAAQQGDLGRAVELWQRLAATDPLDSGAAAGLMHALVATGDTAGALRHARLHEILLKERGAPPDATVAALAQRLGCEASGEGAAARRPHPGSVRRSETSGPEPALPPAEPGGGVADDALGAPGELSEPTPGPSERALTLTPTGARAGPDHGPLVAPWSVRRVRRRWSLGAVLGLALTLGVVGAWLLHTRKVAEARSAGSATDSAAVAIFPFRVAGADSGLAYLREGMVDLLAVTLAGGGDLRAVDPRPALRAWRSSARGEDTELPRSVAVGLAEHLGAGQLLTGSVTGTPKRLVIAIEDLSLPSGEVRTQASVEGPADSLPAMVDHVAADLLLGSEAAADPARTALASTPLEAIRQYLDGQAAYRRGRYDEAVRYFSGALAIDSTFALAAIGLGRAAGWAGDPALARGARLAWRYRDRLPARLKTALIASVGGPEGVAHGYTPDTAAFAAWERAAEANPGDPEMWYNVGDRYLHGGTVHDMPAPLERAAAAFRRALTLDPAFAPANVHLVQVEAHLGDTAAVRRFGTQFLRYDSTGESAQIVRWRMAIALGDSAALRSLRAQFGGMGVGALRAILATAQFDGVGLDDAERALGVLVRRQATPTERWFALLHEHAYALNRGRAAEALRATQGMADADPAPRWHLRIRILDALYAGGDSVAARMAVDSLRRFADGPPLGKAGERRWHYEDVVAVTQWELWHGRRGRLDRALRLLDASARGDSLRTVVANRIYAALLRAVAANTAGRHDLSAVEALDSAMLADNSAPFDWPVLYPEAVLIRLFALNGRPDRALTAARRWSYYFPEGMYLSQSVEWEARLAAQLGDTAEAARARRHLVALRGVNPVPPLALKIRSK